MKGYEDRKLMGIEEVTVRTATHPENEQEICPRAGVCGEPKETEYFSTVCSGGYKKFKKCLESGREGDY